MTLISDIYSLYGQAANNGWNSCRDFWVLVLKVQVAEMELDLARGDAEHFNKELADAASVAIDALKKLGYSPEKVLADRLEENRTKIHTSFVERDYQFYQDKLDHLSEEIYALKIKPLSPDCGAECCPIEPMCQCQDCAGCWARA